jgi:hypothetical protein
LIQLGDHFVLALLQLFQQATLAFVVRHGGRRRVWRMEARLAACRGSVIVRIIRKFSNNNAKCVTRDLRRL